LGCRALVVSSTGNAAAATAAYGRRAGIPAIVLVAKSVDPIMSGFVQSYRPYLVKTPTKADRWVMMKHCVEAWNCYPAGNYMIPPIGNTPYMIAGYKTMGFEIWEQLGRRAPDWIFGPSGSTNGLSGIYQGFQELKAMGLVAGSPSLGVGEIYGSLSLALKEGSDTVQPAKTDRPTVAISIGAAQNAYQGLDAVRGSGGTATQVDDEEILAAQKLWVESEGMFGETASAAGLAALIRELDEGRVERDAEIVILLTSTGLKSLGVTGTLDAEVPLARDVVDLASILQTTYGFDAKAI
jgi:threonine synthase